MISVHRKHLDTWFRLLPTSKSSSLLFFFLSLFLAQSILLSAPRLLVTMVNASWCIDASITCQLSLLSYLKFTLQLSRDRLLHSSRVAFSSLSLSFSFPYHYPIHKWNDLENYLSTHSFVLFRHIEYEWRDRETDRAQVSICLAHRKGTCNRGKKKCWSTKIQADKSWNSLLHFLFACIGLDNSLKCNGHRNLFIVTIWPFFHERQICLAFLIFFLPLFFSFSFWRIAAVKSVWVRVTRRSRGKKEKERKK